MINNKYSNIGSIFGLLALGIALFHFFLGPIEKTSSLEEYVANKTVSIKSAIVAKLKGDKIVLPQKDKKINLDRIVDYIMVTIAFFAIVFGVFGLIKKEEFRVSGIGIALGIAAIVFEMAIIIAGTIIAISLIGAFLGG